MRANRAPRVGGVGGIRGPQVSGVCPPRFLFFFFFFADAECVGMGIMRNSDSLASYEPNYGLSLLG